MIRNKTWSLILIQFQTERLLIDTLFIISILYSALIFLKIFQIFFIDILIQSIALFLWFFSISIGLFLILYLILWLLLYLCILFQFLTLTPQFFYFIWCLFLIYVWLELYFLLFPFFWYSVTYYLRFSFWGLVDAQVYLMWHNYMGFIPI